MLGGILNTLRNVFAVEVKVGKTIRAVSLTIGMVLLSACTTLSEVKTSSPEAERQWMTHQQDLEQFRRPDRLKFQSFPGPTIPF